MHTAHALRALRTYAAPCTLQAQASHCARCIHGTRTLHAGRCVLHPHCAHCTRWTRGTNCPAHARPRCAHTSQVPPLAQSAACTHPHTPPRAPRAPHPARAGRLHPARIPACAQTHCSHPRCPLHRHPTCAQPKQHSTPTLGVVPRGTPIYSLQELIDGPFPSPHPFGH